MVPVSVSSTEDSLRVSLAGFGGTDGSRWPPDAGWLMAGCSDPPAGALRRSEGTGGRQVFLGRGMGGGQLNPPPTHGPLLHSRPHTLPNRLTAILMHLRTPPA